MDRRLRAATSAAIATAVVACSLSSSLDGLSGAGSKTNADGDSSTSTSTSSSSSTSTSSGGGLDAGGVGSGGLDASAALDGSTLPQNDDGSTIPPAGGDAAALPAGNCFDPYFVGPAAGSMTVPGCAATYSDKCGKSAVFAVKGRQGTMKIAIAPASGGGRLWVAHYADSCSGTTTTCSGADIVDEVIAGPQLILVGYKNDSECAPLFVKYDPL